MQRWLAAMGVICLWLAVAVRAEPEDKGVLEAGHKITASLKSPEVHQYTLALSESELFTVGLTVSPDNAPIYSYVLDNTAQLVEPLLHRFTSNTLSQVYGVCTPRPCSLVVEGAGTYTLLLTTGDTLRQPEAVLSAGDTITGRIQNGPSPYFSLDFDTGDTLTLSLYEDRHPLYIQVTDSIGKIVAPLFENYRPVEHLRTYVIQMGGRAPFFLYITGEGSYTLQLAGGDILRDRRGEIDSAETVTGERPESGFVTYLIPAILDTISITASGGVRDIFLQDSTGRRLFATADFTDPATRQRVSVFAPSGDGPFTLTLKVENRYELKLTAGDLSRVTAGSLHPGMVTAVSVPAGMTPVFALELSDEYSPVITLVFDTTTLLSGFEILLTAADGASLTPARITPGPDGLIIEGIPASRCPCTFIPRMSGHFAVSVSPPPSENITPIRLLEDDVNLRAGDAVRFPVIAQGRQNQELRAFARNERGDWLLAMTDTGLVVWVFRGLIRPLEGSAVLDSLPVTVAVETSPVAETTPEPVATPESVPSATATTTPVLSPVITLPASTGIEPVCMITSGGGINLRTGAGVTYDIAGSLSNGETVAVIAQASDDEGHVWWQLDNEKWVRSDVVAEIGDCDDAPVNTAP